MRVVRFMNRFSCNTLGIIGISGSWYPCAQSDNTSPFHVRHRWNAAFPVFRVVLEAFFRCHHFPRNYAGFSVSFD